MRTSIVVPQSFLPPESVKLGRFVLNVDEPQQEYLDPLFDDDSKQPEAIVKPQLRYEEVRQDSSDAGFAALLMQFVSASRTKRKQTLTRVKADRVTTYQLANSGAWFREAIKSERTRRWLEQAIAQGDDVYVIVGYHTMSDAQIFEGAAASQETSTKVDAPVTASLAAAGVVVPMGDMLDVGVGAHNHQDQQLQRQFVASGEQVCAVQYRKVRFSWFSSRDLDRANLQKDNRWKTYWNVRGEETAIDDVIEVDMEDDLELENNGESKIMGNERFDI